MEKHPVPKERTRSSSRLAMLCLLIVAFAVVVLFTHLPQQQAQPLDSPASNTALKAISKGNINPTPTFASPPTVVADYVTTQPGVQPTLDYADSFWATAVAIRQTLPTASPIPGMPPDKAIGFQEDDLAKRASGTALALYPPPPNYYFPTPVPDNWPTPPLPERTAGAGVIYDEVAASTFTYQLDIANYWWEMTGGQRLLVCAGGKFRNDDPLQGEILVAMEDGTTYDVIGEPITYMTPSRHGIVRVIDAVGERLTLRAEDGTLFYFDVPTRQWVNP